MYMKKFFKIFSLLAVSAALFSGCKNEVLDTNQYADSGVVLNVYGPQPVMRGGELRFLGSNLDKVTEVIIPGTGPVTEINVVKAGVPSEIRIIVPKDGPEPGLLTLKTADGNEIVTKTPLSYSEPVVLESFSPASVKAGDVLSIKGDYLNLIHEVIFSENVKVSEKYFKKHERYEIQVAVPVEARSGVIGIADLDESDPANAELLPNVIYSEEELTVAQPEVTSMTAARYIAGASVKISGKNFQYVAALNLPGAAGVEFSVNASNTEISFILPDTAQDGVAVLVAKSGVEIVAGEYETVVPSGLSATPAPVKAGAQLTISGKDLVLVSAVDLPGAAGVEFEGGEAIKLTVPETATEGDATLTMENGKSVTVAFTLVKPVFSAYSENPAAAGSTITISGTDLDLVKSVTFGGDITVEVEASAEIIEVAVPTTAANGAVKLNLANGTSVECEALTVNKPSACYITELPAEGSEIYGGTVLIVPVENEDKLESVEVNGEAVKFLLNGKELYICLPDMAGKGSIVRLISSNGAVEYSIDCIPNNIIEKVIWSGSFDLGSWSNNFEMKPAGLFEGIEVGQRIRIYGTPTGDFFQVKVNDGMWAAIAIDEMGAGKDCFEPDSPGSQTLASGGYIEFVITEAIQDALLNKGDWGNSIIFNGMNFIITKVTYYVEIPMDVTIWEGDAIAEDWANQPMLLTDGGAEFAANGVKVGSTIYFYITPLEADWKLQIVEGHWGPTYASICSIGNDTEGGKFVEYDLDGNGGRFALEVSQEIYDAAMTQQWWGGIFLLNGDNVKVTRISVLN